MTPDSELPKAAGPDLGAIEAARRAIVTAKRDFGGFIEGESLNVSEDQFKWISYRMSQLSDADTFTAMARDDESFAEIIWLERLSEWRTDPAFAAFEKIALGNKREGTRLLLVHQAGKVLRVMSALLESRDPKIQIRAVTLWSRQMGLLLDKLAVVDKDDLTRLAERLMQPSSVQVLPGPSIEGEWTESPTPTPRETMRSNSES